MPCGFCGATGTIEEDGDEDAPCPKCDGEGYTYLTGCLKEYVGSEMWTVTRLIEQARNGAMPLAGGTMDQPAWFAAAWALADAEEAKLRAARMPGGGAL